MFQNSMCYVTGHWCSETDSGWVIPASYPTGD